jgi:hypothetical protein
MPKRNLAEFRQRALALINLGRSVADVAETPELRRIGRRPSQWWRSVTYWVVHVSPMTHFPGRSSRIAFRFKLLLT